MIRSDTRLEDGSWKIKEMEEVEDDEVVDEWFVLQFKISDTYINGFNEDTVAWSFTHVHASGGLLQLKKGGAYDGEQIATFAGVLDGANEITGKNDLPDEIARELKEIGPW